MRVSQLLDEKGQRIVCCTNQDGISYKVSGALSLYSLAWEAINRGISVSALMQERLSDEQVDLQQALDENRIQVPIDHPDPVHMMVSGSGLSHSRWLEEETDLDPDEDKWPDYAKVLMLGKRGGKPTGDELGAQPEWFYKGTGEILVAPGAPLTHPYYGTGIGEEAEIAGIYIIGPNKEPYCLGFTLGNESADEQMYFRNVYHLAQSKKRPVSLGPEMLIGELPKDIRANVSIERKGEVIWDRDYATGEDHMLHSIANIEAHYFKYKQWYCPGDVHVLYFGNAVMSTDEGEVIEDGDIFKLECDLFGLPLVNPVLFGKKEPRYTAQPLW